MVLANTGNSAVAAGQGPTRLPETFWLRNRYAVINRQDRTSPDHSPSHEGHGQVNSWWSRPFLSMVSSSAIVEKDCRLMYVADEPAVPSAMSLIRG